MGSIILVYLLGKKLYGKHTGLLAALFLAVNPVVLQWNRTFMTDNALEFFFLATALATAYHLEQRTKRSAALSGFMAGLALFSKLWGLSALFLALAVPFIRKDRWQNLIVVAAVALAIAAIFPVMGFILAPGFIDAYIGHLEWNLGWSLGLIFQEPIIIASLIGAGYVTANMREEDHIPIIGVASWLLTYALLYYWPPSYHLTGFMPILLLVLARSLTDPIGNLRLQPVRSSLFLWLLAFFPVTKRSPDALGIISSYLGPGLGSSINSANAHRLIILALFTFLFLLFLGARVRRGTVARTLMTALTVAIFVLIPLSYAPHYIYWEWMAATADYEAAIAFLEPRLSDTSYIIAPPVVLSQLEVNPDGFKGGSPRGMPHYWARDFDAADYVVTDDHWRGPPGGACPWGKVFEHNRVAIYYQNPKTKLATANRFQLSDAGCIADWAVEDGKGSLFLDPDRKEGNYTFAASLTSNSQGRVGFRYDPQGAWNFSGHDFLALWVQYSTADYLEYYLALRDLRNRFWFYTFRYPSAGTWQRVVVELKSGGGGGDAGFDLSQVNYIIVAANDPKKPSAPITIKTADIVLGKYGSE